MVEEFYLNVIQTGTSWVGLSGPRSNGNDTLFYPIGYPSYIEVRHIG